MGALKRSDKALMTFRVRSIDCIPELEYMEYGLEILRFYGDAH